MEEILVWYEQLNGGLSNSLHLTVKEQSIAFTIAEFESRNRDVRVTAYMNENNEVINIC
jgi:predicted component of type VI protein secretion system